MSYTEEKKIKYINIFRFLFAVWLTLGWWDLKEFFLTLLIFCHLKIWHYDQLAIKQGEMRSHLVYYYFSFQSCFSNIIVYPRSTSNYQRRLLSHVFNDTFFSSVLLFSSIFHLTNEQKKTNPKDRETDHTLDVCKTL